MLFHVNSFSNYATSLYHLILYLVSSHRKNPIRHRKLHFFYHHLVFFIFFLVMISSIFDFDSIFDSRFPIAKKIQKQNKLSLPFFLFVFINLFRSASFRFVSFRF